MALEVFRVESSLGPVFLASVIEDLERALDGQLPLPRPAGRAGPPLRPDCGPQRRPSSTEVRVDEDASDDATVIEVHAADAGGLLYRITQALADLDLDIVGRPRSRRSGPRWSTRSTCGTGPGAKVTDPACWSRWSAPLTSGHVSPEVLGPRLRGRG